MSALGAIDREAPARVELGLAWSADLDGPASRRVVTVALAHGVRFFATADHVGPYSSESSLGQAIRRRSDVVVATSIGRRIPAAGLDSNDVDGRPDYLRVACDCSLHRLRTDHVDLLVLAGIDPSIPIEDSVGTLTELRTAGKAVRVGMANVDAETLRLACRTHRVDTVVCGGSIIDTRHNAQLIDTAVELGVDVIADAPFGRALTYCRPHTIPPGHGQVARELERAASRMRCSSEHVALAWLAHQKGVSAALVDASVEHLRDRMHAMRRRLEPAVLARLDRVSRTPQSAVFPASCVYGAAKVVTSTMTSVVA